MTSEDYVELFLSASRYLYPFLLEFTLTSSAMLAEIWMGADRQVRSATDNRREYTLLLESGQATSSTAISDGENSRRKKITVVAPSMIGFLALGSFILIIFLMHSLSPRNNPGNVYQIFYTIMSVIATVLCIVGLVVLHTNPVNGNKFGLDEGLLLASVFGTFSLCLCSIYSAIFVLRNDDNDNPYAILTLAESLMWIIQAGLQSNFIAKALHRKPKAVHQCCGIFNIGSLAIILAFVNIGMWLFNTIDLEGHYRSLYSSVNLNKLNELQNEFFGKSTWTWIMLVIYPLAIFFRIHSVSTLYRVYQEHKKLPTGTD